MKRHIYRYLSLSVILSSIIVYADNSSRTVTPKFTIRSQGSNTVRRVMGSIGKVHLYDMDKRYWNISLTPEYTRSFDSEEIAECLFGESLCDGRILKIQGSRACNRHEDALLADYFYLPTDFKSEVSVEPRIQNFIVDLNFYLGLDNLWSGFYCWLQAPLAWSKWDLRMQERVINPGINDHDEGYFTPATLGRRELLNNFVEYTRGEAPGKPSATANVVTQFVNFQGDPDPDTIVTAFAPLKCAKMCKDSDTQTQLSEIRFGLGWNFLLDEDYHLGLNIQASGPTGNNVKPDFLFDAQNGNNDHWELGAGLSTHYVFWRSDDEEKHFGFYLDANVTHLFKKRQRRCFDLCGKPLSRYMLAARMDPAIEDINLRGGATPGQGSSGTASTHQFARVYSPVANLTTFDVDVHVGVNADLAFWFNYTRGSWSWDFGYNFWARSCEKIRLPDECNRCDPFPENTWALKGDAHMFGFMRVNDDDEPALQKNDPVALAASMSEATINGGNNFGKTGVTQTQITTGRRNPKIDKPQLATAGTNSRILLAQTSNVADPENTDQINTSITPVFIGQSDINFARTKGISHKLFYHMNYTWLEKEEWVPYFGWGAEAEWATSSDNDCDNDRKDECDTSCDAESDQNKTNGACIKCGLSQWGVWAKFGVSFN